jgi:hypothetical protein
MSLKDFIHKQQIKVRLKRIMVVNRQLEVSRQLMVGEQKLFLVLPWGEGQLVQCIQVT